MSPAAPEPVANDTQNIAESELPQGWYRHFCLFVLFLIIVLAYADRTVLSVSIEAIKRDFGLSDLQMGLLSGPAFALFYTLLGIPLARWTDMGNRRTVVTVCLAIWSAMTALAGACQNFTQLFLTRIGVGVGEAGALPPSHSLVAEYYPAHQHGKAASVLTLASFIGGLLGLVLGGALLAEHGWQVAMYALGLPGLAVALLARFVLKEPRKSPRFPRFGEILDRSARRLIVGLFRGRTFFHLTLSMAVYAFFFQGVGAFVVPFFIRSYGVNEAQVGATFGPVFAGSAVLGAVLAAIFIDKLQRRDVAWLQRFPALCCGLAFPCYAYVFLAADFESSLQGFFVANTLIGIAGPAIFATLYAVVPGEKRGMAVALVGLISSLVGIGIGPVAVGAVSDSLAASLGSEALRFTLAGFSVFTLWACTHMLIAAGSIGREYVGQRPDQAAAE